MRTFVLTSLWIVMWVILVVSATAAVSYPWNALLLCALVWVFLTIDRLERKW